MTVLGTTAFETVDFGGNLAHGCVMTEWGAAFLMLQLFGPGDGFGAPSIYPEKIKSRPLLTMSGPLSQAISSDIWTICQCVAATNFKDNSRAAAAVTGKVTCIYGDANVGGFTTTGCIGARLRLTGRTNQLIQVNLAMFGTTTTQTSATAGAVTDTEFYPFELCNNSIGADTVLGFDLTFETGLVPVYPMDNLGPTDGYGEVADIGAQVTLQMLYAMNAAALTEYGKYHAITAVTPTLTLTGTAASTEVIAILGYYTDWGRAVVDGILCHRATITGHTTGTALMNVT